MTDTVDYGLWSLVILNSAIFIVFAFSFTKPRTKRDWGAFGAFSAFILALFAEMYGFPVTLYLLSVWPETLHPHADLMSHGAGHLWFAIFGWKGNPHTSALGILSDLVIFNGFVLLSLGWTVLYQARQLRQLATIGVYAWLRHPQYLAFIVIMAGFLLQWPTLLTLAMFPVLVAMYVRLAHAEEREAHATFGTEWDAYSARVPPWVPRLGSRPDSSQIAQ